MSSGKGFVVHIETCNNMTEIRRRTPNEIIPARWSESMQGDYVAALRLEVERQKGIIAELASIVTQEDAGIENIKVDERSSRLSIVLIELFVRDRTHLARVMRRLRVLPSAHSISRIIK
jgi:GTP pyrophosphokinase